MNSRTTTRIKRQWDKLEGRGNRLDFDRAQLLHTVYIRLQKNEKSVAAFIVGQLGVEPGKRPYALFRLAEAFDANSDQETWDKLGGTATALLTRVKGKVARRRILKKVDASLKSTGRSCVSSETFRKFARAVLGHEAYQASLTEPKSGSNTKAELAALKAFVLTLIAKDPSVKRGMSQQVKRALGLDILTRRQSA
jgi:hypothetical protein